MDMLKFIVSKVTVQAIVTVALTGAVIYVAIAKIEASEYLVNGWMLALGYYFGSKASETIARMHGV